MRAVTTHSSISHLSPEAQLLLCCARTVVEPATRVRMAELLRGEIDWPFLFQFAAHHGLTQLLYWNLNAAFGDILPPEILERLRGEFVQNAQHSLHLTRELIKLLGLLDANQIPAVPYKGPVLAHKAYGNLSFRQFCDLDILVPRQHVLKAMQLFAANGYHLATPLPDGRQAARLLTKKKDYKFISSDGRAVVELHWRLTGKHFYFSFDLAEVFKRLVPVTLAGAKMQTFAPEDYLLILCAHGSKHVWLRLLWVSDVSEVVRAHPDLDWQTTLDRSEACDGKRMLLLGLYLARELFGATLPKIVEEEIQADAEVKSLADEVVRHVFSRSLNGVGKTQLDPHELYPLFIRMRDHKWDKVRLEYRHYRGFLHAAITPNRVDRELVDLPAGFNFLYYLLRPLRLIKSLGERNKKATSRNKS